MGMKIAAFATWAVQAAFDGCHLDGYDIQDKAVKFGILTSTQYNPAKHGDNDVDAKEGDEWFVYSDEFKALLVKEGESLTEQVDE